MKFTQTDYFSTKTILKFPDHYVGVAVTVDDTDIAANADGKKIVPAGTIAGGIGGSVLADNTRMVQEKNSAGAIGVDNAAVDAEGVLLSSVDVTYGPAAGTIIVHGFIDKSKLPTAPHANAITALKGSVFFMGGNV
ncbi:hypothetical protein [Pelosinus sp. sgz500959]|uniref:hypothetical protein n=1 Tax=Pelosinus sp. sgz500959 TaxID=3242472 RepID=UPI00366B0B7B